MATAPRAVRASLSATLDGLIGARTRAATGERAAELRDKAATLKVVETHGITRERYVDHAGRLGDLDRLVGTAAEVDDLGLWLAELTLDPPLSTGDLAGPPHLDEDYVSISTIHSAKGLEWPIVHIPHVIDGAFPSDMALGSPTGLAEERRLFYVAVTRAKDELSLYSPLRLPHHRRARDDRHSYAPTSRFLDAAALAVMEVEEHMRPTVPVAAVAVAAGTVEVDVSALWN